MVAAMKGSLGGLLGLNGTAGTVQSDDTDLAAGNVRYHVRWNGS